MLHSLLLVVLSHALSAALGWAQMAAGVAGAIVAFAAPHSPPPVVPHPTALDAAYLQTLVSRQPAAAGLPFEPTAVTPHAIAVPSPETFTQAAILAYIADASQHTGVSAAYLEELAFRESRFDPAAASASSSARGLYQFIEATWLDLFARYGGEHGEAQLASLVVYAASGRPTVADPDKRKEILDLRFDPQLASFLAARLAEENRAALEAELGRPIDDAELYMAHFLGVFGAATLIQMKDKSPETSAAGLLPSAARANQPFFYDPSGRDLPVSAVYATLASLTGEAGATARPTAL